MKSSSNDFKDIFVWESRIIINQDDKQSECTSQCIYSLYNIKIPHMYERPKLGSKSVEVKQQDL